MQMDFHVHRLSQSLSGVVTGATHDSSGATDMKLLTRDATAFTPGFKGMHGGPDL